MAPSRVEDIFPKTQRLTPSTGPKFTSDAITVYRVLKATRLEDVTLLWQLQVKTLAAERLSSWSVKREQSLLKTESAKSLTEQVYWFNEGSNLVVSNSFFYWNKLQCTKQIIIKCAMIIHVFLCPHVLKRQNLTHLMRVPGNSMSAESPPILCCLGQGMTWHCPLSIYWAACSQTHRSVWQYWRFITKTPLPVVKEFHELDFSWGFQKWLWLVY